MATRRNGADKDTDAMGNQALEKRLGHVFGRPELLELALTHRSYSYERRGVDERTLRAGSASAALPGDDNEQLEFLGDAVLGLVVAESLYRQFPESSEGELTRLRSSLVSRKRMAEVGAQLGLGEFLILGKSAEQVGGRKKPALLANAAEAVIAALYLDGGLDAARKLIDADVIAPVIEALSAAVEGAAGDSLRDHKTLLQERVQATGAGKLRYIDAGQSGPAHQRRFNVEAQLEGEAGVRVLAAAEGGSKKEAQQRAAELALERWSKTAEGKPSRKRAAAQDSAA